MNEREKEREEKVRFVESFEKVMKERKKLLKTIEMVDCCSIGH